MDDLIAWLRAQLDDDERVAQTAKSEPGNFYPDGHYGAVAEFLGRWNPVDPVRVLTEVDAKRRILDDFSYEAGETRAVMLLAEVYADRPGYREKWRP